MQREDVELPVAGSLNPSAFAEYSRHFIYHDLNRFQTVDMSFPGHHHHTMRNVRSGSKKTSALTERDAATGGEPEPSWMRATGDRFLRSCTRSEWGTYLVERLFRLTGVSWHTGPSGSPITGAQVVGPKYKAFALSQAYAPKRTCS